MISNGTSTPRVLPGAGTWLIGRSPRSDVQLLEPGVSRRQALLHLGPRIYIQDLGSANGTRVGERELRGGDPIELRVGEPVEVGFSLLIVSTAAMASNDDRELATVHLASKAARPPPAVPADDGPVISWETGSDVMRELLHTVERVAKGEINVLVLGETGVGKDVVAQEIHRRSPRAGGPFLRVNCATLSENLLESELFGHERGAFTGANQAKAGLFETAAGGTIFLDEVGELPPSLQAKLLLVLEERKVRRVGGVRTYPVDARFISATNRDLGAERARQGFRTDLYFRLNGVSLRVPALRDRPDEIVVLANHFLQRAGRQLVTGPRSFSDNAMAALRAWHWPGNVRELRNVIERAVLLATGPVIARAHLRLEDDRGSAGATDAGPATLPAGPREADKPERQRVLAALEAVGWNQTRAAAALGMARNTLIARMRKFAIRGPRAPRG